jgi:hypothetical protein
MRQRLRGKNLRHVVGVKAVLLGSVQQHRPRVWSHYSLSFKVGLTIYYLAYLASSLTCHDHDTCLIVCNYVVVIVNGHCSFFLQALSLIRAKVMFHVLCNGSKIGLGY